jgi:ribose transport system permease protein
MTALLRSPVFAPLAALILVTAVTAFTTARFFDPGNLSNLALQVSIVAIVAIGSTFVILTGGIDLSPGSAIALLTMLFAVMIRDYALPLWLAIAATIALGVVLGSILGWLTAYVRIPSFITTLAALSAFRGMAFMFNAGSPIFSLHPALEALFYGTFLGLPLPLYYLVVLFAVSWFVLRYTPFGRSIYAVGGNPAAARLSGLNVRRIQFAAFAIGGLTAALGAVLMAARLNSGSPNYGVGLELSAIAAAVIGGASLSGGRGNIINTLIGALTIVIVQNGLNLNAVPTSAQTIVIGAIILVAVGIDVWRREIGGTVQRLTGIGLK